MSNQYGDYNTIQMNNLNLEDNYLNEDAKQDYNSNYNPSNRITSDSTKVSYRSPKLHYTYKNATSGSTTGKFIENQTTGGSYSTNKIASKNKSFTSSNFNSINNNNNQKTPKTPKSLTGMKSMKSLLSKNSNETGISFTFDQNVKQLETMIHDIKSYGFDRIKTELDDKLLYKRNLENNVNTLENSLKIIKGHNKHNGNSNSRLIKENDSLLFKGDVKIY